MANTIKILIQKAIKTRVPGLDNNSSILLHFFGILDYFLVKEQLIIILAMMILVTVPHQFLYHTSLTTILE